MNINSCGIGKVALAVNGGATLTSEIVTVGNRKSLGFVNLWRCRSKGITTPSVKWSVKRRVKRQGPIGMHCDAPKSVPDPFHAARQAAP